MKCKQRQSGKRAAAEELVSRLLRNYEHWKDDLQEALIYPESGLKDLGEKLSGMLENKSKWYDTSHKKCEKGTKCIQRINISKKCQVIILQS